jgi:hypothetical protein
VNGAATFSQSVQTAVILCALMPCLLLRWDVSLPAVHLQDLLSAAKAGDAAKVQRCLDQDVDINCSDEVGVHVQQSAHSAGLSACPSAVGAMHVDSFSSILVCARYMCGYPQEPAQHSRYPSTFHFLIHFHSPFK